MDIVSYYNMNEDIEIMRLQKTEIDWDDMSIKDYKDLTMDCLLYYLVTIIQLGFVGFIKQDLTFMDLIIL